MYAAAKTSRLTGDWGQTYNTSADSELRTSLWKLRNRSRQLVRDSAYAKRAKVIIVNNVVGIGIGMQAQVMTARGKMNDRVNSDIESAWENWCLADSCHTGGTLHFNDFERALIGQVFEAGEVFIRKHYQPFGDSKIPFALELIEAERIADEFQPVALMPSTGVRMGIESDIFHRPTAYWLRSRHPGDLQFTLDQTAKIERVPADQIIHLRLVDRWPQTRGEPWLHAAARRLNDMDGYSEAEIVGARAAANYMGIIESPEGNIGEEQPDGSRQMELEPGTIEHLNPGEKFNFVNPNRPNANMDPFMRLMLREVAAGIGTSYESLSRDYSQSNYSSSRLALLDDRDLWRVLQMWFLRSFRRQIHREWLQQAVLSRAITTFSVEDYSLAAEKFEAVMFKTRGWSWVDPVKEVDAYREAVRSGFMTVSDVIALTNGSKDLEDLIKERRNELDKMAEAKLLFDTDPAAVATPPRPISPDQPSTEPTNVPVKPADASPAPIPAPPNGKPPARMREDFESVLR